MARPAASGDPRDYGRWEWIRPARANPPDPIWGQTRRPQTGVPVRGKLPPGVVSPGCPPRVESHGFSRGRRSTLPTPEGDFKIARFLGPQVRFRVGRSTVAVRLRPRTCFPARIARSNGPSHPDAPGVSTRNTAFRSTAGCSACWVPPFASDQLAGTWWSGFPDFLPGGLWTRSVRRGRRPRIPTGERRHTTVPEGRP